MLTVDELAAEAAAISVVAIEQADRDEFAVALVLQGYEPRRGHQMAYETLADNDGALQMLARQRRRVAWAAALPKEGEEAIRARAFEEALAALEAKRKNEGTFSAAAVIGECQATIRALAPPPQAQEL